MDNEQQPDAPRLCTIRCPLLHVASFASSAVSRSSALLSSSQAAALVVELIDHVCAQLQLTPASWSDMQEMYGQLESHRAAGHSLPSKFRPFMDMMRGMHALRRSVQRAFVDGLHGSNHSYPRVQQMLLMFGSSLHNPLLIFRLHIAYEQRSSPDDARQTQALSRSMVRQLMQHSALLFPTNLPSGLHSAHMRLHSLFEFDRHADAAMSVARPLSDAASSADDVADDAATPDFSEYAGLQFKPDYAPKLINSYSFAAPHSPRSDADDALADDAAAASSSASASPAPRPPRRVKPFRIPKPKSLLPLTILIGTAEQTAHMAAARYDPDAIESSAASAGVWYQCASSISFSRRLPPMPEPAAHAQNDED